MKISPDWRTGLRELLLVFGLWTALCVLVTAATQGEMRSHGDSRSFLQMAAGWWFGYAAMMVETCTLLLIMRRWPALLLTPRRIALTYMGSLLLFWPVAMLGLAVRRLVKYDLPVSFAHCIDKILHMDKQEWIIVFALLTVAFFVIAASQIWRQRHAQARELERAKLALERQRLAILRGQLEPHFMFNTLSAIIALVQVDDKQLAVDGLSRMSDLLRYALSSSERDWVSMEDELHFVHDYLELQRLRYGMRLQVRISGEAALAGQAECPPMLLQPLLENALRHDLDCHTRDGDVEVTFTVSGARLLVRVSNPLSDGAAPRPGLGIGLRGTRARLQMAYGDTATLRTWRQAGRFVADLCIPLQAPA